MDTKKMDVHELLSIIMMRLDRIENMLRSQQQKNRSAKPESIYSDDKYLNDDYQDNISDSDESHTSYVSDDELPILLDERYDSDNDLPLERPEVFPEPKLSLSSLQIQLANEEFMQYTGSAQTDDHYSQS